VAEVVVFHHALGLTTGLEGFAERLGGAGHLVHLPDLYEGATFLELDEGVSFANGIGPGELLARAASSCAALREDLVYVGFSLGALAAQALAQRRRGALGAILCHGGEALTEFSPTWPTGVALQLHSSREDPWIDRATLEGLAGAVQDSELFWYEGDAHLFADPTGPDYRAQPAAELEARILALLDRV
jgi:dienelactone hydrolase